MHNMRKGSVNLLERQQVAEKLALEFYKLSGFEPVSELPDDYMHTSQHPRERYCLQLAYIAIDFLMVN